MEHLGFVLTSHTVSLRSVKTRRSQCRGRRRSSGQGDAANPSEQAQPESARHAPGPNSSRLGSSTSPLFASSILLSLNYPPSVSHTPPSAPHSQESPMSQPLFIVDAFTTRPFSGNPAAVCLLDQPADERWMQDVAAEMNLSETAFLHPTNRKRKAFGLRWFTPRTEVDLCGHATLASAHILWEQGHLRHDEEARFLTRSGPLTCTRQDCDNRIAMDFPAHPPVESPPHPTWPTYWARLPSGSARTEWTCWWNCPTPTRYDRSGPTSPALRPGPSEA